MEPVDLFYSYAHEDRPLRDELAKHLKIMERRGVIRPWHDGCIVPGQAWNKEISDKLESADLVLLLISLDFMDSEFIWSQELDTAMKRHARGEASVVPVMLKAYDIEGAPFAKLQGLPSDLRPVTSWPIRDEAWTDVAKGIRRTVEHIQAHRKEAAVPGHAEPPASPAAPSASEAGVAVAALPTKGEVPLPPAITASARVGTVDPTARVAASLAADPLLARVVEEFSSQVAEAAKARGAAGIDTGSAQRAALALIDAPEQKRVLWVDDRPSNNRREAAALAKLQIEVVQVTDTDAALARIASDPEAFDLVLSDWTRPEPLEGAPSAGIRLLRGLRRDWRDMPVVFYHGSFDPQRRQALHDLALAEGAYGEAVMPVELLGLVSGALGLH